MPETNIAAALAQATSPVILISAVGLLLLTMNNRLMHSVDRARALKKEMRGASANEQDKLGKQIAVIYERAGHVRRGIESAVLSALCSSGLVATLFHEAVTGTHSPRIVTVLVIGAVAFLALALIWLILDVRRGLTALALEVQ